MGKKRTIKKARPKSKSVEVQVPILARSKERPGEIVEVGTKKVTLGVERESEPPKRKPLKKAKYPTVDFDHLTKPRTVTFDVIEVEPTKPKTVKRGRKS
jgi:hypothetical protein